MGSCHSHSPVTDHVISNLISDSYPICFSVIDYLLKQEQIWHTTVSVDHLASVWRSIPEDTKQADISPDRVLSIYVVEEKQLNSLLRSNVSFLCGEDSLHVIMLEP